MRDPDYSPEMAGRLSKLESAISKQRTIKFSYWSPRRDQTRERTLNPYALRRDRGIWYVVGHDLDNDDVRTFRVSRIRSDIRFATRRERDFRLPADFDVDAYRVGEDWQHGACRRDGADRGERRHGLVGAADAARGRARSRTASSRPSTRRSSRSPAGCCARTAAPSRSSRRSCAPPCAEGLRRVREAHEAEPPKLARAKTRRDLTDGARAARAGRRAGALRRAPGAARLPARRLRRGRDAELDADDLVERFHIPREELQEHLSLLNLVNFGGGCYTVYAELDGDVVRVDKELYGDVFRLAPRLTPLEARAIRLALDIVGPSIAAQVHTPLDRVRKKLEETFGQFEDHQAPETRSERDEEELVATLSRGIASAESSRSST